MSMDDMSQHKEAFLVEAREHIASMNAALLRLEGSPTDTNSSHDILRAAHTLKSMAAAMNYVHITELCHAMENLLVAIQNGIAALEPSVDVLFECFDFLEVSLGALAQGSPDQAPPNGLIEKLHALTDSDSARFIAGQEAPVGPSGHAQHVIKPIQTIAVSVGKLDVLLNLAEEMLVARMRLDRIEEQLDNPELSAAVESLGRLISDLQYNVMQARMVPIGFVFGRYRRMVRDLARLQNKEVELVLNGGDIELDRAVIDEIGECLVHLIRNALDHGIELPEERTRIGKPRHGTIKLTASRTKEDALIVIEDDGSGLDLDAIKQTGLQHGILASEATDEEITQAIFQGVSTTSKVTEVSGRGMGLNIAKKKIETIGGDVTVESMPGRGTRFVMEIPLTLAVIKTLFVSVSGRTYAIPVANIDRLVTINRADLKSALGHEAIVLEREEIPIARLDTLFNDTSSRPAPAAQQSAASQSNNRQSIVIVRKGSARLGVAVDALMSTEEVVIKPLNRVFRENRFFAGSALIGSGEVALVLEVGHLMFPGRPRTVAESEDYVAA